MNSHDPNFFNEDNPSFVQQFLPQTDADTAQAGGENIDFDINELLTFAPLDTQPQSEGTQNIAIEPGYQEPAVESKQNILDNFILKRSVIDEFLSALDKKEMDTIFKIVSSNPPVLQWLSGEQPAFSEVPPLSNHVDVLIKLLQSAALDSGSIISYTRLIEGILNENLIFIQAIRTASLAQQKEILNAALLFPWSPSSKFMSKLILIINEDLLNVASKDVDAFTLSLNRITKTLQDARSGIFTRKTQIKEAERQRQEWYAREQEEQKIAARINMEKIYNAARETPPSKKQKTSLEAPLSNDEKEGVNNLVAFFGENRNKSDDLNVILKSINSPTNRKKK